MPPRLSLVSRLRALDVSGSSAIPPLPRASPVINAIQTRRLSDDEKKQRKRRLRDPYIRAQYDAQRAARHTYKLGQEHQRLVRLGDPVRGVPTPFVESFDTTLDNPPPNPHLSMEDADKQPAMRLRQHPSELIDQGTPNESLPLMHGVKAEELKEVMDHAKQITLPVVHGNDAVSLEKTRVELEGYAEGHARAERAIIRILNLANGSARDRLKINVNRCVTKFGRHNTDSQLPARPSKADAAHEEKMRGGPDTGSPEVQIGILTVKIRALADALSHKATKDKHNKRNLRLLVHRRQKLLKYLKRKEKGGPRWQHCIETLGLTPGSWEGEISL